MSVGTLRGSFTAHVTPFRNRCVDENALCDLVEWQIASGTNGLVPTGTTGEASTLSLAEHLTVVKLCVDAAKGRVPVIAGAGSNDTAEAVHLARRAAQFGVSAVMAVVPYYNRPTQEGIFQHFAAIAAVVDIPVVIYNIPTRCGVEITMDTMARLRDFPSIVGVKDATGDVGRVSRQGTKLGAEFIQFWAEDMTTLAALAAGAHGAISVVSNIAPALCASLHAQWIAERPTAALAIQDQLTPLHDATFLEPGLVAAKYALSLIRRMLPDVRLPLSALSPLVKDRMRLLIETRAFS